MSSAAPAISETVKPPRRKRWIPLSLRMFVMLMVLLFVGSVLWVGVPAYRQRAAVRAIEPGGYVNMGSVGPNWVRDLIGDDWNNFFGEPYELILMDSCVDDAFLAHVSALTRLKRLIIDGTATKVTDAGLANLAGMTELRGLFIPDTNVTDAGLMHLSRLPNLLALDLRGTKVTSAGVMRLVKLRQLEYLELSRWQITAAEIAELKRALPKLAIFIHGEVTDDFDSPNPSRP